MSSNYYEQKLKEKEVQIKSGIPELEKKKNSLFELKKFFYGDFKYNKELQKVPNPNRWIQDAIGCLENAIREALKIKVNSV